MLPCIVVHNIVGTTYSIYRSKKVKYRTIGAVAVRKFALSIYCRSSLQVWCRCGILTFLERYCMFCCLLFMNLSLQCSCDCRRALSENILVIGGVVSLPGFK